MGSILQDPARRPERSLHGDRDRNKEPRRSGDPNESSNKTGRRQPQGRSAQAQVQAQVQRNHPEQRRHRRKPRSKTPATKCTAHHHSAHPAAPVEDRVETKLPAPRRGRGEPKHTVAFCRRSRPDCSTELLESPGEQQDSESDLSDSPSGASSYPVSAQLELRPEVIEDEDLSSHSHRVRGRGRGGSDFPDFLPPPFNSWSLSQLAVFYNTEGVVAGGPRPVGPLERYLERLLQLEWHQIQTVQEELGKPEVSEVISSCHRSAASSCLSSPKCILQCQRAFPLTLLSSVANHSTLVSGGSCTLCRMRYSSFSTSCCHSAHAHGRQSRLSPMLESSQGPPSLPRRSYSESRAAPSDRVHQAQRFIRTSSYRRRMEASGNIRNPTQSAADRPWFAPRDSRDSRDHSERRSGSELRRGAERRQVRSEKSWSGSDCRKGRAERRRADNLKIQTEPENLPEAQCSPVSKPGRPRAVEFVT